MQERLQENSASASDHTGGQASPDEPTHQVVREQLFIEGHQRFLYTDSSTGIPAGENHDPLHWR